jgi:hypothetical protein
MDRVKKAPGHHFGSARGFSEGKEAFAALALP